MSRRKKMIFDIASLWRRRKLSGIPRFIVEVLRRLNRRNDLELVLICSHPKEEQVWLDLRRFLDAEIPFQSKYSEKTELTDHVDDPVSDKRPTFLGRMEDRVLSVFPDNRLIRRSIDLVRAIKWKISPPPPSPVIWPSRPTSPFLEKLVRESDVYFSPFFPFIQELEANPSIRKVLMVHDLLPLLIPDEFDDDLIELFGNMVRSLPAEAVYFANSDCTKNDLLRFAPQIAPSKITTIPLGADDRFAPCRDRERIDDVLRKYGVAPDTPYILSLAMLEKRKNFESVLRAFAKLLDRYGDRLPNLELVLTGSFGRHTKNIQRIFGQLSNSYRKRIHITGYVDDADLPLLYNGASCFTYMSLYEGFGLPPLEAMQSGTPVVVSNNSSLPEVVGDAGILLDAKDEDGLVDAFLKILTDEPLRNTMIEKGLRQARKFNWDRCVDMILEKLELPPEKSS